MLKVDLARLEREGRLRVDAEIPADDPLWEGTELTFDGPLRVVAEASVAGSGEVVVRGRLEGTLARKCRRCLDLVEQSVDQDVTLVWAPRDELDPEGGDLETRPLDLSAMEVDLASALREELVLTTDRWVVCDSACLGLCPRCGANQNVEECDCTLEEPDPRWEALRALKHE
jgi:uncharacterized protein